MLRATSRSLTRGVLSTASRNGPPGLISLSRNSSSSSSSGKSGGGTKFALATGVAVVSFAGATFGYAGIDPDFRKLVENAIPGAKDVFNNILGDLDPSKAVPSTPSKMRPVTVTKAIPPLLTTTTPLKSKASVTEPTPMPPLEEPPVEVASSVSIKMKNAPEVVEIKQSAEVKKAQKKTADEDPDKFTFDKLVEDMKVATGMAVLSARQSCESIEKHGHLVVNVLEQNVDDGENERAWHDVIQAANEKSESLKQAYDKIQAARNKMEEVSKLVEQAADSTDPEVIQAVKEVEASSVKMRELSEEIGRARKEAYLIEKYRDLVEEGRQSFRKELSAVLPEQPADSKLTEEEVNLFITHAYRKISNLQQQLAKLKLFHTQFNHSAVNDQQLRKQVVTEEVVRDELEAQKRHLDVDYQQRIHSLREDMEGEIRSQLRRQAAAHSDHVIDTLEVQASELIRQHERKLDEALSEERSAYAKELAKLTGQVDGLKASLRDRAKLQQAIKEAQELWLSCCALKRALHSTRPESGFLPMKNEIKTIRNVAKSLNSHKEDEEFVNTVLDSLPNEALSRGVHTDQTVRDRFFKVEQMAKRAALIPENGGSLLRYFLSYLQSFFVLTPSTQSMPDPNVAVDLDLLSTFDVVWLAKGSIERGDLEQAVKYMTLLEGEARNVSMDWINEARLLLETKQACDVLLAHAAAFGLEAFPEKPPKD